ncbi:hypothetical protein H5410_040839 [Solanum commersonii]|uniref:Uncharacterized protein n=1 Tax=Solanum commersonii TaxID=4109 RepID=A0A9J5XRA8_SOLCO|nr:hypothetical protein H5410_040839 [Solanum commersonii]
MQISPRRQPRSDLTGEEMLFYGDIYINEFTWSIAASVKSSSYPVLDCSFLILTFGFRENLWVVGSQFELPKEEHLVTFRSSVVKTQIDFLLLREGDKGFCKDFKVIPSENLSTQHKLLVMDLEIRKDRKKRAEDDWTRIKWGSLTMGVPWR